MKETLKNNALFIGVICLLIGIICMTAVLADATFYANRPSYKGEICDSIYENTDINIGFTLQHNYKEESPRF